MDTTTISIQLPQQLTQDIAQAASAVSLSVDEYVTRVLAADVTAANGSQEMREARAAALARVEYLRWMAPIPAPVPPTAGETLPRAVSSPSRTRTVDIYLEGLVDFIDVHGREPDPRSLAEFLYDRGVSGRRPGHPVSVATLRRYWPELRQRYSTRYE
jgi:hypothetical protein